MSIDTDVRSYLPDTIDLMQISPESIGTLRASVDTCESTSPANMLAAIDSCLENERQLKNIRGVLELLEFRRDVMHEADSSEEELVDNDLLIKEVCAEIDKQLAAERTARQIKPPTLHEDDRPYRGRRKARSRRWS